jgi:hypothetical protein
VICQLERGVAHYQWFPLFCSNKIKIKIKKPRLWSIFTQTKPNSKKLLVLIKERSQRDSVVSRSKGMGIPSRISQTSMGESVVDWEPMVEMMESQKESKRLIRKGSSTKVKGSGQNSLRKIGRGSMPGPPKSIRDLGILTQETVRGNSPSKFSD